MSKTEHVQQRVRERERAESTRNLYYCGKPVRDHVQQVLLLLWFEGWRWWWDFPGTTSNLGLRGAEFVRDEECIKHERGECQDVPGADLYVYI